MLRAWLNTKTNKLYGWKAGKNCVMVDLDDPNDIKLVGNILLNQKLKKVI